VVRGWHLPARWEDRHELDSAVLLLGAGGSAVETHAERLAFWPFTHGELEADLAAAGLSVRTSTYAPDGERYAMLAERPPE
jgi:hypothetical protein